jgi:antitoxin HicB
LVQLLKKRGWTEVHVRGSHHILSKGGRHLSVPVHAGKELGKGLLPRTAEEGWTEMKKRQATALPFVPPKVQYPARIRSQDGGGYLVEFLDLPGCLTEGDTRADALANAAEALSGWLYVAIKTGQDVPVPSVRQGRNSILVEPDLDVTVPLLILWARKSRGLTQSQMAHTLGVTQQAYQKLEIPGKSNPRLKTLSRLFGALGLTLELRSVA